MGRGRKSAEDAINVIDDLMSIVDQEALGNQKKIKNKKKKKVVNLDSRFWAMIEDQIAIRLKQNYDNVSVISNTAKYTKWKERASEKGLKVKVLKSGTEEPVIYTQPKLRTGFLRESLKYVNVVKKTVDPITVGPDTIEYSVNLDDFEEDYGHWFNQIVKDLGGHPFLELTEQQTEEILDLILAQYERG